MVGRLSAAPLAQRKAKMISVNQTEHSYFLHHRVGLSCIKLHMLASQFCLIDHCAAALSFHSVNVVSG